MSSIEPEVISALEAIENHASFVMTGGAGSGKIYSMLSLLREYYNRKPNARVYCITFTNVAVVEIKERFSFDCLQVSTIHEFLWQFIKRYQKNLRQALQDLIGEGEIKYSGNFIDNSMCISMPIKYTESRNLVEGRISHDEVLKLAHYMFEKFPLLRKILADSLDLLLVDEYQDTPKELIDILFRNNGIINYSQSISIGLFGDGEQSIHEDKSSRNALAKAIENKQIVEIRKEENRRNPSSVIKVINHLRVDGLKQRQSNDRLAPNFEVSGSAIFLYTNERQVSINDIQSSNFCENWSYDSIVSKFLFLGKAMIAKEGAFSELMSIYDKNRVVEYAKRVRKAFIQRSMEIREFETFAEVKEKAETIGIPPTATQKKAFDREPSLLEHAHTFRFLDIAATKVHSDRLIGVKKVSDKDLRDRGERRDHLIKYLFSIQELLERYKNKKFNELVRSLDITIDSIESRDKVYQFLERISTTQDLSIGEVLQEVDESGILRQSDQLVQFRKERQYLCDRVSQVPYREVKNLYAYVEDHLPFSTQHGVKGSEWDNIFVSLDNGKWNKYNFMKLLRDPSNQDDSVIQRSRMMLYVACSRARRNLIVYAHNPPKEALECARKWFGADAVISFDESG